MHVEINTNLARSRNKYLLQQLSKLVCAHSQQAILRLGLPLGWYFEGRGHRKHLQSHLDINLFGCLLLLFFTCFSKLHSFFCDGKSYLLKRWRLRRGRIRYFHQQRFESSNVHVPSRIGARDLKRLSFDNSGWDIILIVPICAYLKAVADLCGCPCRLVLESF